MHRPGRSATYSLPGSGGAPRPLSFPAFSGRSSGPQAQGISPESTAPSCQVTAFPDLKNSSRSHAGAVAGALLRHPGAPSTSTGYPRPLRACQQTHGGCAPRLVGTWAMPLPRRWHSGSAAGTGELKLGLAPLGPQVLCEEVNRGSEAQAQLGRGAEGSLGAKRKRCRGSPKKQEGSSVG